MNRRLSCGLLGLLVFSGPGAADPGMVVGSKKFTENVILAEIAAQLVRDGGHDVRHRRDLGGTRVLWGALLKGDIDLYPEYTGTLMHEILAGERIRTRTALEAALARHGIHMSGPLGFSNNYVLGMLDTRAGPLGIETISDLKSYPGLRLGFGNEFMDRGDGWPGLRDHYALPHRAVRGMDHDLAYRGLAQGSVDVMDLYSTDAEIAYYDIRTLEDDRGFFPDYQAVYLFRSDLGARIPGIAATIARLENRIGAKRMSAMNAAVKLDGRAEADVAAAFNAAEFAVRAEQRADDRLARFLVNTRDHLVLVGISLSAAIIVAVPLGIAAARNAALGRVVLGAVAIVQTVPSLALFVFMIPLLGIGGRPAVAALFLYSLLPIIRNTHSGLHDIPASLRESAVAIGLPPGARLRLVELPLAVRSILSGIKTSAVINVGTATLGALIGAGGYGQPILTGIRLDDTGLILEGAVPAAVLALAVQGLFDLVERWVLPASLRYRVVG